MGNIQKKNMKQRYVSLLTNGGFKAFFGDENNKEVVRMLINILLPEHRKVVEIDYMPTEHQGPVIGCSKEFHYDFMCRDVTGEVVIVEMQRYRESDWFKRCVSYAGRAYDRQNRSGMDYDVPPVFLIGLMGVDIDHPDKEFWKDRYVSEYTFREKSCGDLLDETICIIFAELTRFRKGEDECETDLDRVLYLIKNSGKMQSPPKWGEELLCRSILDACEIDNSRKTNVKNTTRICTTKEDVTESSKLPERMALPKDVKPDLPKARLWLRSRWREISRALESTSKRLSKPQGWKGRRLKHYSLSARVLQYFSSHSTLLSALI